MSTLVTLIRHGQASFGAANYDQLSPVGEQQCRVLGEFFARQQETADLCIRGSLQRHGQSLAAFQQGWGQDIRVEEQPAWNEFDHRAVMLALATAEPELKPLLKASKQQLPKPDELLELFFRAVRRWQSGGYDDEYPESWAGFTQRIAQAWSQLPELVGRHRRVLIFTSGGPVALSALQALGVEPARMLRINRRLANSGYSRFILKDQPELLSLNEHSHLSGQHRHLITYR